MLGVVLPVFNKIELTRRCLSSLLEHSQKVTSVVVVDNGSRDSTPSDLEEFRGAFSMAGIAFEVITNPENIGFGRAVNQGLRRLMDPWVVILNNDTWLAPGWDRALVEDAERLGLDLIGPHFDERPWHPAMNEQASRFLDENRNLHRRHFVPILMCFRRSAVARLQYDHGGIFDERFFVTYEDTDLRYRMERLGLKYGQTSNSYIWHQSMGTRATPGLLPKRYEAEGLKLFIEKWGFDPRPAENTFFARWKRKLRMWKSSRGRF